MKGSATQALKQRASAIRNDPFEKESSYRLVLKQAAQLLEDEGDIIANLANISSLLASALNPLWVGFYLRKGTDLVLGPYQGPLACTRIPVDPAPKGVCGISAKQMKSIVVPDVHEFVGHIACSSLARSEIVVPWIVGERTCLVLDIDSEELSSFDEIDQRFLEELIALFGKKYPHGI